MKKLLLAIALASSSLVVADVTLITSFKATFDARTLSKQNPVAYYALGGQEFKVVLAEIIDEDDALHTLYFEVFSLADGVETLISRPMFKKEKTSLATLTLGTDEYSMTLSIR